jgi:hypothetical protein
MAGWLAGWLTLKVLRALERCWQNNSQLQPLSESNSIKCERNNFHSAEYFLKGVNY